MPIRCSFDLSPPNIRPLTALLGDRIRVGMCNPQCCLLASHPKFLTSAYHACCVMRMDVIARRLTGEQGHKSLSTTVMRCNEIYMI